jgi:hypothetical protein
MNKPLRLVLLALLLLVGGYFAYRYFQLQYTKQFSPEATAEFDQNGLHVKVDYCQPAKKGRLIFGTVQEKALVPYGKVWRTGANEATLLTVEPDVTLAGKPLPAGRYTLWTIPGPGQWQVVINNETGQWGTEYDPSRDRFRVPVPAATHSDTTQLFTMSFRPTDGGADLLLRWDTREVTIPIRKN